MITSRDIKTQVLTTLDGYAAEHDVEAIVSDIIEAHGLVDVDGIPDTEYWEIVKRHAI